MRSRGQGCPAAWLQRSWPFTVSGKPLGPSFPDSLLGLFPLYPHLLSKESLLLVQSPSPSKPPVPGRSCVCLSQNRKPTVPSAKFLPFQQTAPFPGHHPSCLEQRSRLREGTCGQSRRGGGWTERAALTQIHYRAESRSQWEAARGSRAVGTPRWPGGRDAGWGGRDTREGGGICAHRADWLHCTAEAHPVKQICSN